MSIFNETIVKIDHIYDNVVKGFLLEREKISERLHKFLEEFENEQKLKNNRVKQTLTTTLQSINEDEDEQDQIPIAGNTQSHLQKSNIVASQLSSDKGLPSTHNKKQLPEVQTENDSEISKTVSDGQIQRNDKVKRISKKRIKDEIDDPVSPEVDKRQKRSASVKAQSTINKMVNMPLNQKLRRDNTAEEQRSSSRRGKGRKDTEGNKENTSPPIIIKQEKISLPAEEPMDVEPLLTIAKKEPVSNSEMLPPPIPKPRRVAKDKSKDVSNEAVENEEQAGRRSRARAKKQADAPPIPPVMRRSARVNSRANLTEDVSVQESPAPAQEGRPKRTKKKQLNEISNQCKEDSQQPLENGISREGTPDKPRPKRTRKVPQKYIEEQDNLKKDVSSSLEQENEKSEQSAQENEKFKEPSQEVSKIAKQQPHIEKKDEIKIPEQQMSVPQSTKIPIPIGKSTNHLYDENVVSSPILQMSTKYNYKNKSKDLTLDKQEQNSVNEIRDMKLELEKTRILNNERDITITLNKLSEMNSTVILPSSKFTHDPVTPKVVNKMNETIVLQKPNTALPPTKAEQSCVVNDTMVLHKEGTPQSNVLTDDNSLLTDDNSEQEHTPPHLEQQETSPPKSAVKEKVQQFEEMATRMTRTKTKALAKKVTEDNDNETPPNKGIPPKSALSVETLSKLNSLIFNGKPPVVSSSATKLKPNNISNLKSFIPGMSGSTTPNAVAKAKEAADESSKKEKEDARKKKEALLQAKREERKRKREEKMAAAAAAREAAERERLLALEAARKERMEKQAHADLGKLERLKEAERKKQEQARKIAETEERRRAEEQARLQKLAEEQKRAEIARKKQQEEAEATKREVALATKELEKRKKEYIAKQKLQQRMENNKTNTPLRMPGTPGAPAPAMEPVHMADGFQYLNSDDDEDKPCKKLEPAWSTNKARLRQLRIQAAVKVEHIDRMFSVRRHTPDLREIFPMISRHALKRTSSAVWRTPPGLKLHMVPE